MLTDNEIRKFDSPKNWPSKRLLLTDRGGLALDVLPSGVRSWVFRYRSKDGVRSKMTIARYPDLSLRAAREERDKLAGQVARGGSPAHEQKAQKLEQKERAEGRGSNPDLRAFADRWYNECVLPPRGRNYRKNPKPLRGLLDNQLSPALGDKLLCDLTKADVRKLLFEKRNAGYPAAALKLRQALKSMLDYAVTEELLEFNPVALIPKKDIGRVVNRERDLGDQEIRRFLEMIEASSMTRSNQIALRVLLLTWTRKAELLKARWVHIDFERAEWTIPKENSKNGRAHVVPLAPQTVALFRELQPLSCQSEFVVPSRYTIKRSLDASNLNKALSGISFEMEHFTIHDLRRTGSTRAAEHGWDSDLVELALNHRRVGIRQVYNRSERLEERKEMLNWWANRIDALTHAPKLVVMEAAS
jgi:integrase